MKTETNATVVSLEQTKGASIQKNHNPKRRRFFFEIVNNNAGHQVGFVLNLI